MGAKSEGVTPGFTIVDSEKKMYFVKFDPISNPEMATGDVEVHVVSMTVLNKSETPPIPVAVSPGGVGGGQPDAPDGAG